MQTSSVDTNCSLPNNPNSSEEPGSNSIPESSPTPQKRLGSLALRGSVIEMSGYGTSQLIRLISNMVLSRLLFPEAFGLMALVNVFMYGLTMLSDVGIGPAIIQSPHGDEPRYLNTAWSIQVVRGFILFIAMLGLSWPLSILYREPKLFWLICASSISLVLGGFSSTAFFTLRRSLSVGKETLIDFVSQCIGLSIMIPWAYFHPTVWSLVGGTLAGSIIKVVASHLLNVGYRNRFEIDPDAKKAITHFGKWIFFSSIFYFIGRQADRLLLGRFLGVAELGVYSIAIFLSEAINSFTIRITHGVLYSVFSRVREEGEDRLCDVYYRTRLVLDALALPALGALMVLGPNVVHFLYDSRYTDAGWMLQAFALRVAMACMVTPCETCLSSMGLNRYVMYQNIVRTLWIISAVPLGWYMGGLRGLVFAVALSEIPVFFILWPAQRATRVFRFVYELRAIGLYVIGIIIGWLLYLILPDWSISSILHELKNR